MKLKHLLCALALWPSAAMAQNVAFPTINASVTITTNSTFQTILAPNSFRRTLEVVNNNLSNPCYITFGTTSTGTVITAANATLARSILIPSNGGYFSWALPAIPSDEIEGTCTGTGTNTIYVAYR